MACPCCYLSVKQSNVQSFELLQVTARESCTLGLVAKWLAYRVWFSISCLILVLIGFPFLVWLINCPMTVWFFNCLCDVLACGALVPLRAGAAYSGGGRSDPNI